MGQSDRPVQSDRNQQHDRRMAIWRDYAFVWGVLLGITQILDAAKEYLPQAIQRRNASEFLGVIECHYRRAF
jgi:hypothetical protein